jgi:murein DD-endopeptidase MepM/ murein hydrolase activator NlpD
MLKGILYKLFIPLILIGFFIPQHIVVPVEGAGPGDWNENTFWHYPWGKSITHKGIDIFAPQGRNVVSATHGLVIFTGINGRGGNAILVLGPKWRIHYYAHLKEINTQRFDFVKKGEKIGTVGSTGNASNSPAHLHYSILSLIPYPWRIDSDKQGYLKMLYLNPIDYLNP